MMGVLSVSGLGELSADLDHLAAIPESVVDGMLNASADVIVEAQRKEALRQWRGKGYDTGETAHSIKKGRVKKGKNGRSITVSPQGTNKKGERHAAVAFVNEYGAPGRGIRPRQAIRTATERATDEAVAAGEKVLGDYLDKKNL